LNNKMTFLAISTVVVGGFLGVASAALANDIDASASGAQAAREMGGNPLPWWWNAPNQGAGSYAYQPVQPSHGKISKPKK
jgi:hypothetical protein